MTTLDSSRTRAEWPPMAGMLGIGSMIALVVGLVLGTDKPINADAALSKIVSHMTQNPGQNAVSGAIVIVGSVLFLSYAAYVASELRAEPNTSAAGSVVLVTATTFAAFAGLDTIIATATGFVGKQVDLNADPALTRLLFHLYNGLLMPGAAQVALSGYFAAIAYATFRGVLGPKWLAWVSAIAAPLALINGVTGLSFTNGGSFPLAPVAPLALVILTVTNSVTLIRKTPKRNQRRYEEAIPAR